jgi:hypothetical protein
MDQVIDQATDQRMDQVIDQRRTRARYAVHGVGTLKKRVIMPVMR